MKALLVLGLLLPTLAHAQADLTALGRITAQAHEAARTGNCGALPALGQLVRQIDATYYSEVFAVDPELAACMAPSGMAVAAPVIPTGNYKSPSTALAWSLGLTLGGYGIVALATSTSHGNDGAGSGLAVVGSLMATVGPTAGHIYAGKTWNTGLGMRLLGTGTALLGFVVAFSECPIFSDNCNQSGADVGIALAIGGVGLYVTGVVYEIATAGSAAREANAENHQSEPTVGVVPMVTHDGGGVAVAGRF